MTTEQTNESGVKVSEIQTLTSRLHVLSTSVDTWNNRYVFFVALAVFVAALVLIAQFVVISKSKETSDAQSKLMVAKDAQALLDSKDKDVKIAEAQSAAVEANEGAIRAQKGLAEANA
ncbi:MAG: hypothetical protein ABI824_01680, partial [Acidobacteriota bacterium]